MAANLASLETSHCLKISEASSKIRALPAGGRGRLLQVLGMWFGMAAAIGNTIAAGIVRTPGDVARLLPNAWMFLAIWILGGLYAFSGASSMAELGAAIPRSGGQYNFFASRARRLRRLYRRLERLALHLRHCRRRRHRHQRIQWPSLPHSRR